MRYNQRIGRERNLIRSQKVDSEQENRALADPSRTTTSRCHWKTREFGCACNETTSRATTKAATRSGGQIRRNGVGSATIRHWPILKNEIRDAMADDQPDNNFVKEENATAADQIEYCVIARFDKINGRNWTMKWHDVPCRQTPTNTTMNVVCEIPSSTFDRATTKDPYAIDQSEPTKAKHEVE